MTLEDRPLLDVLTEIQGRQYTLTNKGFEADARKVRELPDPCEVLDRDRMASLRKLVSRRYMALGPEGDFDLGFYLRNLTSRGNLCILSDKFGFVLTLEEVWTMPGGGDTFTRYIITDSKLAHALINLYVSQVKSHMVLYGRVEYEIVDNLRDSDSWEYTEDMELTREKVKHQSVSI